MTNEEAHRLAREKGVSRPLYALVRGAVSPFLRVWFRMHVSGASHVPESGAAIVAPNPGGSAPFARLRRVYPRDTGIRSSSGCARGGTCGSWRRRS